jgi:hypothetical protein
MIKNDPGKKPGFVFLVSKKRWGNANNMLHIITCSEAGKYFENFVAITLLDTRS